MTNKLNVNDTLQYITGAASGFVGINAIPTITEHANSGNVTTALIGLATMILQAFIMKWNKKNEVKKQQHSTEILDLQRQINDLKSNNDHAK